MILLDFKTLRSFEDAIRNSIITMDMANHEQEQLANKREFARNTTRKRKREGSK